MSPSSHVLPSSEYAAGLHNERIGVLGFRFSRDKDLILLNLLYLLDFRLQQVGQCGFSGSPGY